MTRRVGPDATPVSVVVTRRGSAARGATVTVMDSYSGLVALLYADEFLRASLPNPIIADTAGRITFYVEPGQYHFVVPAGFDDIDDVIVGYAANSLAGRGGAGSSGAQGPQGPQGPAGATGSVGPAGPQGMQGPSGPPGTPGTSDVVFMGPWSGVTTYPAKNEVTYLGEAFVSLRPNANVTPVEGDDWTKVSSKGPVGAQGATGPQGPVGPQGSTGAQGPVGADGAPGAGTAWTVVSKTADYTAAAYEFVRVNAAGGAVTITVPVTAGAECKVMKVDSSSNPVSINRGSATSVIYQQNHVRGTMGNGTSADAVDERKPYGYADFLDTVTETGSFTLGLQHMGVVTEVNSASAVTCTVPPASSVAWIAGSTFEFEVRGAGQLTFVEGAGVTIESRGGAKKSAGQYAQFGLRASSTTSNRWALSGDITT